MQCAMMNTGSACSLLLLMMAAVSSGRNAREYFQQAGFQKFPARPEDALVFFTATAPPLVCELEKNGDWVGGDRAMSDLILDVEGRISSYACSFEGNATTHTNLNLIPKSLDDTLVSVGKRRMEFRGNQVFCTTDSQLPDEYFHLTVQRPNEERPVKCRVRSGDESLYLRFPGYPTIVCKWFDRDPRIYRYHLPGIVADSFKCAFLVYSEMLVVDSENRAVETKAERLLFESLLNGLPRRTLGIGRPRVTCSNRAISNGVTHFQILLPGGSVYHCSIAAY